MSSLSTFTAHLRFLSQLWQELADLPGGARPVLVLIDEIGTGTEPGEGAAFAYGVICALLAHPVKIALTTHYDLLKTLAYERDDVKNVCLEFDEEHLRPTYRVLDNQPGRSYALAIARRWGIAAQIVNLAESMLGEEERRLASVIGELDLLRRQAEQAAREAQRLAEEHLRIKQENELLSAELLEAKLKFAKQAERTKQELERRIDELLNETKQRLKSKARQSIRKHDEFVKAASKSADVARQQKDEVAEELEHLLSQLRLPDAEAASNATSPAPGDQVVLVNANVTGKLLSLDAGRNHAVVEVKGKRLEVKANQLRHAGMLPDVPVDLVTKYKQGLKAAASSERSFAERLADSFDTIDLHGQTVEEAFESLEVFLSRCLERDIGAIRIMHGIGTGRLRAFVLDYLKKHPQVLTVKAAPSNEGGVGVTLATLK